MKAIILAAGMGTRMHPLTLDYPKCMLKLNGCSIIEHQIKLLKKHGINNIEIITGYKNKKIEKHILNDAKYYFYPNFKKTNNLYTLNYHLDLLNQDLLILFSDVLISSKSLNKLLNNNMDFALLVDTDKCDESTMRIVIENDKISDIGSHIVPKDGNGNFIGIAKFSNQGSILLRNKIKFLSENGMYINDYYTKAIAKLAMERQDINPVNIDGLPWMEIDTYDEYQRAQKLNFYVI